MKKTIEKMEERQMDDEKARLKDGLTLRNLDQLWSLIERNLGGSLAENEE